MTFIEALEKRESNMFLIGKQFYPDVMGWDIKAVIISPADKTATVYELMYHNNISNDVALKHIDLGENPSFELFVISHQWPWGSGNLVFQELKKFQIANPAVFR